MPGASSCRMRLRRNGGSQMTYEGSFDGEGLRIAIVASRFNDEIVSKLLEGAVDCLQSHDVKSSDIDVFRVPGAFELPAVVNRVAATSNYDAVIALGAVIRGETPHFEFISSTVTDELSRLAIAHDLPIAFGVITPNTMEQAVHRTLKGSNNGWEAALAALETATLMRSIRPASDPQES